MRRPVTEHFPNAQRAQDYGTPPPATPSWTELVDPADLGPVPEQTSADDRVVTLSPRPSMVEDNGIVDLAPVAPVVRGRRTSGADIPEWADSTDSPFATDSPAESSPQVSFPARLELLEEPPRRGRVWMVVAGVAVLATVVSIGGWALIFKHTSHPVVQSAQFAPAPSAVVPTPAASVATAPPVTIAPALPPTEGVAAGPTIHASVDRPAVMRRIAVGPQPQGVAVTPDSKTVFVANEDDHTVSIIDAGTRAMTVVHLAATPRFVAVSPDNRLAFVSTYEDDLSGSTISVVDATKRAVVRTIATGPQPYAPAVAPDGDLWVPIHSAHRVEIYGGDDLHPVGVVATPANPHSVGFSPDGRYAYTPDHESNLVSRIDMRTHRVDRSIGAGQAPHCLAVSPDGQTILVVNYGEDTLDRVNAASLRRTARIRVGDKPQSVAFAPDGRHAYVANEAGNSVSVIDVAGGRVTATIPVGPSPRAVAVAPDGQLAYVTGGDDNAVTVLAVGQ